MAYRIDAMRARPLRVPLIDPFVIASGRIDATRAVLVEVTVLDEASGERATGLGEGAALPPVTREDQTDILEAVRAFAARVGTSFVGDGAVSELSRWLDGDAVMRAGGEHPVARAAVEAATLDAITRLRGVSMFRVLPGGDVVTDAARFFESDITVPIHAPAYMGELAEGWRRKGFRCFKVKVGINLADDLAGLRAIRARVPDARFRLDANGGYDARTAIALFEGASADGLVIECFEQPCARDDVEGMALVTRELGVPVVADESVHDVRDLEMLVDRRAANGVNLKVVKMYGPLLAAEIGRRAHAMGLSVMCGAMVETRLGITTAAHVCAAVGAVEFVDLDTAWLLREDPFRGGYRADGPSYELPDEPGQAIEYLGE